MENRILEKLTQWIGGPNEKAIVRHLIQNPKSSRTRISRQLSLSMSTVTNVTDILMRKGFIHECGVLPTTTRGRSSIMLDIRKELFKAFGVGMNASLLTVELLDMAGTRHAFRQYPLNKTDGAKNFANMKKAIREILAARPEAADSILGIGVAVPGFVEYNNQNLDGEVITAEWNGGAIAEKLEQAFGYGVAVGSASSSALSGESYFGEAAGYSHVVYVNISGGGVGWARMRDRVLDPAAAANVRALGHMTMNFNGPVCACGQPGCLDLYVDKRALVGNYLELAGLDAERSESRKRRPAGKTPGYLEILELADRGDYVAVQAVAKCAGIAGLALANMAALHHPDLVILAGRMVENCSMYLDIAGAVANKKLAASLGKTFTFKGRSLRRGDGWKKGMAANYPLAVGAATLVFEGIFTEKPL